MTMVISNSARILLLGLVGVFFIQTGSAASQSGEWNRAAYRLSPPGTYVRYAPNLVSDRWGRSYAFWSQDSARPCCFDGAFSLSRVARFDGVSWSEPVDILKVVNGRVQNASIHIDSTDTIHAVWVQREAGTSLYYSNVAAANVLNPEAWQIPRQLDIAEPGRDRLKLRADGSGTLHLLFTKSEGIFYTRSTDGGVRWTVPVPLDAGSSQNFVPGVIQLELDDQDGLHAIWHHMGENPTNQNSDGRQIQYVRSTDGGLNWSAPYTLDQFDPGTDDPLTQSVGAPYGFVIVGTTIHVVWVGGPPGGPTGVGRKHRISPDRGLTWGVTTTGILNGLWGVQNGDGLAADAAGRIHWVGLARNWLPSNQLWEGLWGARWSGGAWSEPEPVVTILPVGADSSRLTSTPDGQLVAIFRKQPGSEVLFATHTTGPYFYFSHYADGDGWSMQLVINNLSQNRATGRLIVYDKNGTLQELPFDSGPASEIQLTLEPLATSVIRTLGSSVPIKTGYIRVELDQREISGVAIFKNVNGTEASVLPARFARRYALFVERTESLLTGIAFARHTPNQPIMLKLLDLDGNLLESKEYTGTKQDAKFVYELFPDTVPEGFRGLLLVESEALISAMGLRFGSGILSTIPVSDLDAIPGSGTFLIPHYGDGDDLSMLLAVNNLSDAPATGTLSIFDPGGNLQDLPLETGSTSQVALSLPPNSSTVIKSLGTSSPAKSGFFRVELDQQKTSGVAIFQYSNGREASVLPSYPGKKFALFVERTASFFTGLAISRVGTEPVTLSLYDEHGNLQGSEEFFDGDDLQGARFIFQIFSIPEQFRGLLIIQSDGEFATVGLRFGGNVLSTIPVTPIN